jgi:hypothetical protein
VKPLAPLFSKTNLLMMDEDTKGFLPYDKTAS